MSMHKTIFLLGVYELNWSPSWAIINDQNHAGTMLIAEKSYIFYTIPVYWLHRLCGCGLMDDHKEKILQFLNQHQGENLDAAIAAAIRIPLYKVRLHLSELEAINKVVTCHSTKFVNGIKTEGTSCRLAGYHPPASPGRKPKSQLRL